ncbi:MAG TPA: carboxypeptidase-like regulatory domain-containing protein [Gemmatimonadaceae bacterium]|nr:carboxypeptidase-like regulatory domain-containing protein [Gemmatimonadaceae bacterium]
MTQIRQLVLPVLLASLIACHGAQPPAPAVLQQPPDEKAPVRVARTMTPVSSSKVPPGELVGIVVDDSTGQRLEFPQVFLSNTNGSAVGDALGRFTLAVPPGTPAIRVMRVGYEAAFIPVDVKPDSGYVVSVAIRKATVQLCRVFLSTYYATSGVVVVARDVLTGAGPSAPITISFRSGAYADSVTAQPDSLGRLNRTLAPDRPGTYSVSIRAPGYYDWSGTASTHTVPDCGGQFDPAVFHAWLVPR